MALPCSDRYGIALSMLKFWTGRVERPSGSLDVASRKLIAGWAVPMDGDTHATVDISIDGKPYASLLADGPRPDLGDALGRTDLGFVLAIDLPREDAPLTVSARIRGAKVELPNSPCVLPPISQVKTVDNPDWYREETRKFLKWRFQDAAYFDGIYNGHQPLYGFGVQPCEPGWLERYTITHAIMTELAGLEFHTLADIGGAEGYKGAMIRDLFGADVVSADLSAEACTLAEQIYGLKTKPVAMEQLPFDDESFDVVLCSESLEHVSQPTRSISELLRIARRAVVITVPAEPLELVSHSIQTGDPHGHVNWFGLRSFDYLAPRLHAVVTRAILNTDAEWRGAGRAVELAVQKFKDERLRLAGRAMIESLVLRDRPLIEQGAPFNGLAAVLQKLPCERPGGPMTVSIEEIMDFTVPFFRQPAA